MMGVAKPAPLAEKAAKINIRIEESMKRNRLSAVAAILLCMTLLLPTGCGSQEEVKKESLKGTDPGQYITLGEYKGLKLEKVDTTVSEGDIEVVVLSDMETVAGQKEVTGRAVKEGDITNIDYVGKKDGVAFEGGTGNYDLEIGSGSFIPGFEDGVIGMKIGETKDIPLTFPEDYHSEELAGQDVVFTVSLNSISERVTPGITDDGILEKLGDKYGKEFKDTDEYFEEVRTNLIESKEGDAERSQRTQLMQMVFDNTECDLDKLPEWLVTKNADQYIESMTSFASQYGASLDDYLSSMGIDRKTFEEQAKEYAKEVSKEQLVIYAIASKENIQVTEQEVEDYYSDYAKQYGADVEVLKSSLDVDTLEQYLLSTHVEDYLYENAVIE